MRLNTNNALIEYYKNLLILQYKTDKIEAHMGAVIKPLVIFELIQDVKNGYNIETAVGVQLDKLGKIIGLSRNLSDGITVTVQNDTNYRKYLKFKIIKNFSNHSLKSIDTMLYNFFSTTVRCADNFDMSGNYVIYNDLTLAKILRFNSLFPRPMGVELNIISAPNVPFVFPNNRHGGKGWGSLKPGVLELSDGSPLTLSDGSPLEIFDNIPTDDGTGGQWSIQL